MRPWGLATPIMTLIVCLPLLRPLRTAVIPDDERWRLATIQALAGGKGLAIDETPFPLPESTQAEATAAMRRQGPRYSQQPPVMAALLAGPYWLMERCGLGFRSNITLATYLLTLLGVTVPVAMAGGLVYRMGRLFELRRSRRMMLAMATVFGSGLISYATVLNAHAPAAALVLASCAALLHAGTVARDRGCFLWLAVSGFMAAMAAAFDPGAAAFLLLLVVVILAMRWPGSMRAGGVIWYVLGALPPIALHVALMVAYAPGSAPAEVYRPAPRPPVVSESEEPDEEDLPPSATATAIGHFMGGLLGARGMLSHFPILLLGVGGIATVLHRHWPIPTKALATVCLLGALAVMVASAYVQGDWNQPMFTVRWFVVFLPLLMYWGGAFLRRDHHVAVWTAAAIVFGFSVVTGLLGAAAPFTRSWPGEYTARAAVRQIMHPKTPFQDSLPVVAKGQD